MSALSVLDSLVRAGVQHVVFSPGSRNAPLAYALGVLDVESIVKAHVRIDERSAGFTALGLAKASGRPVVLITTSGTAVGNLLPALMEAYHTGVPLIVLSADRPEKLRGTGANQTTKQPGIFSSFVGAEVDLTDFHHQAPEQIRALANCLNVAFGRDADNWSVASGQPPRPVHINLALDTPLTPEPEALDLFQRWAESLRESPWLPPQNQQDDSAQVWLADEALPAQESKTIVIAGDGAGPIAQEFAQKLGLPLLAEPSSNARFSQQAIEAYTAVLKGKLGEQVERVVVFGHPTLSRPVTEIINSQRTQTFFYEPLPASWHDQNRAPGQVINSLKTLAELAGHAHPAYGSPTSWLSQWIEAGQAARAQALADIEVYKANGSYVGRTAGRSLALDAWLTALERGEALVVGSSNLIRDLDFIAPSLPVAPLVFANRGLAGIDGTIATASGISLAGAGNPNAASGGAPRPVRLICGDLTFLHDTGSLNIGPLEAQPQLTIEVLDDRGGGIFATLEHGDLSRSQEFGATVNRFFTTPHSVDLAELAASYASAGIEVKIHALS